MHETQIKNDYGNQFLIMKVKSAMSLPLQDFAHCIVEQDFVLRYISEEFIYQDKVARDWINQVRQADVSHKKVIINIFCSVIRASLSVVGGQQIGNITSALLELASNSMDVVEENLSGIVDNICSHVRNSHAYLLQEAEKKLLETSTSDDLSVLWSRYRFYVFEKSNAIIKGIVEDCLLSDEFIQCIINNFKSDAINEKDLMYKSSIKANQYIDTVLETLKGEINKLRIISNAAQHNDGKSKIQLYFKKTYLIDYALGHESGKNIFQRYITGKLSKHLTTFFPDIFQKKIIFYRRILRFKIPCQDTLVSYSAYKIKKNSAEIRLSCFLSSFKIKSRLYEYLEDIRPQMSDDLVLSLKSTKNPENNLELPSIRETSISEYPKRNKYSRHSFVSSSQSLFGAPNIKMKQSIDKTTRRSHYLPNDSEIQSANELENPFLKSQRERTSIYLPGNSQ